MSRLVFINVITLSNSLPTDIISIA